MAKQQQQQLSQREISMQRSSTKSIGMTSIQKASLLFLTTVPCIVLFLFATGIWDYQVKTLATVDSMYSVYLDVIAAAISLICPILGILQVLSVEDYMKR